jgi:hypothetical protein
MFDVLSGRRLTFAILVPAMRARSQVDVMSQPRRFLRSVLIIPILAGLLTSSLGGCIAYPYGSDYGERGGYHHGDRGEQGDRGGEHERWGGDRR